VRCQQSNETLSEFLQALCDLSKECEFAATSAQEYMEEMIQDAFINGLASFSIRQHLLEKVMELQSDVKIVAHA